MPDKDWIEADWPAPARVRTLATTRNGGVSQPPYASLNLGAHVGDDLAREIVARVEHSQNDAVNAELRIEGLLDLLDGF